VTSLRPALAAAAEIALPLAVVTAGTWLALLGVLSLNGAIWITLALLVGMLFLSWKRFDGGRHPCFLFLGMLLIFQGGRLVGFAAGMVKEPMQIVVGTELPISVSDRVAEMTLLMVALSAVLIYAPCRLWPRYKGFWNGDARAWLPGIYALVIVTLPCTLYKNLVYLSYIRGHGGYLAVYTDNAAILASAGLVVRTLSTVNDTAILTAYILESRPSRRRWLLILFFSIAAFDLLIGFRGKFFAEAVSLWFIHNMRTGRRFRLVPLTLAAVAVSLSALLIAAFRENKTFALISPLGFFVTQGVSMNVTEAAIQYHHLFSPFAWHYLWNGFTNGITPIAPGPGRLWTWDLSVFLNAAAAENGFGTASSYLAELYLLAGLPAVIAGSLAVGWALNLLHRASSRMWGALAVAFVLPSVIYLPRLELLAPFGALMKSMISLVPIAGFVLVYQALAVFLHMAVTRRSAMLSLGPDDNNPPAMAAR
jgi:hypothetical protein